MNFTPSLRTVGIAPSQPRLPGADALSVLLLCDYRPEGARMVSDHIEALARYSSHHMTVVSNIGDLPRFLELGRFDVVVVHYSVFIASDGYMSPLARERLRAYDGVKAMFIHDEYRTVDRTIEAMRLIGIDVVFTCVPLAEIEKVYDPRKLANTRFVNVLTGYVPERLATPRLHPAYRDRPIDVGYRGRAYPAWHGSLGRERVAIASRFAADAQRLGLKVDISVREEDRLYGPAWDAFLAASKATLGTESGCSIVDFTGEIEAQVEAHVRRAPDTDYETLRLTYFADVEDQIDLRQISPRCFEAIAARSMLILYEGEYSGVLRPWRHFVPLAKDHGNMTEVVAVLTDFERAETIIDQAHCEVLLNPSYSERAAVARFDREIADMVMARPRRARATPYAAGELERAIHARRAVRSVAGAGRFAAASPVGLRATRRKRPAGRHSRRPPWGTARPARRSRGRRTAPSPR